MKSRNALAAVALAALATLGACSRSEEVKDANVVNVEKGVAPEMAMPHVPGGADAFDIPADMPEPAESPAAEGAPEEGNSQAEE